MLANRTVVIAIGLSLVIGAGLFGVISYIPSYAQMVYATGATAAGMLLLPLTAGIMLTNISAGILISRYGRYKIFPVVGTVVAGGAMLLLATMTATTPIWLLAVYLTVLGMGVGMFMQVAMVAVQNAVPAGSVGTATSTVTFSGRSVSRSVQRSSAAPSETGWPGGCRKHCRQGWTPRI